MSIRQKAESCRPFVAGRPSFLLLAIVSATLPLAAKERVIHYSTDLVDYTIKFDEERVSGLNMNAIALLSPFNYEDGKSPYMILALIRMECQTRCLVCHLLSSTQRHCQRSDLIR